MESGREAAHGDVASLLAAKDAENAALPGDVAVPSAEALERELYEHLRKLERE